MKPTPPTSMYCIELGHITKRRSCNFRELLEIKAVDTSLETEKLPIYVPRLCSDCFLLQGGWINGYQWDRSVNWPGQSTACPQWCCALWRWPSSTHSGSHWSGTAGEWHLGRNRRLESESCARFWAVFQHFQHFTRSSWQTCNLTHLLYAQHTRNVFPPAFGVT